MNSDGEATISRALRTSGAVVVALVVIGVGGYLLARIPRTPPIDPRTAPGPINEQPARENRGAREQPIPFTDIANESGVRFVHLTGATGEKLLPETLVGGVAIIDADSDGRQDIVLARGTAWTGAPFASAPFAGRSSVALFLNRTDALPGSAITFDEAASCGLDTQIYAMGIAAADYDGDGRVDLFITGVGENRLFRNETPKGGVVRFTDSTVEANADPKGDHLRWGTSAGFFDADQDGDLDLLVANYVQWSPDIDRKVDFRLAGVGRAYGPPTGFEGDDLLYLRNRGDGTFEDATAGAGFAARSSLGRPVGKALGLVFIDPDLDGDLDVVVANDTLANGFFVNDGHGHFDERGAQSGLAYDRNGAATGAMGIDAGYLRSRIRDPRADDLAIAIGNFANEPDSLYISRGATSVFTDDAVIEGLAAPTRGVLTFGLVLEDLDRDGDLDLAQANGHIEDEIGRLQLSQTFAQPGQVFVNTQDGPPCFVELPKAAIGALAVPRIGRGLATGDFDLDGDADLVMTQAGGATALLRNDSEHGHWLRVELTGVAPNTTAIGARVELIAGGRFQRRLVNPTRSYLSQCERAVTFGLGEATSTDLLTVRWPSGLTEIIEVAEIDRVLRLTQPLPGR